MKTIQNLEFQIKSLELSINLLKTEKEKLQKTLNQDDSAAKQIEETPSGERLIKEFFAQCGFELIRPLKMGDRRPRYYSWVKNIWNHFDILWPFITAVCQNEKDKKNEFDYSTENLKPGALGTIKQFCATLANAKILTFENNEKGIHISLSASHENNKFFHGGYGEMIILYLADVAVKEFVMSKKCKSQFFWNVEYKRPDSTNQVDGEIDVIVQADDRFYFFEVKMGKNIRIDRCLEKRKLFDSPKCRFIMCSPANMEKEQNSFQGLWFIFKDFKEYFLKLLHNDFSNQVQK
ncbi:MAG: hypothetical protein Q4G69_10865 [Planctomycetia bacterium]|nr:hypothetical protein [Planctomycetia bacterium]